jgi:hypothetical protein
MQESVNTEKKKATFLLDAGLHKIQFAEVYF